MPGLFKTSNPALNAKTFEGSVATGDAMTLQGTVNKTGFLLFCVSAAAAWTWWIANTQGAPAAMPWMVGGLIGGFIFAMVTIFKREWSPITAPLLEGLALGGFSAFLEQSYHGIAVNALGLTLGITVVMLVLYTSGAIRATPKFTIGVIAATGGIAVVYLVDMVLRMFGREVPLLNSAGPAGILISVLIVIVAALNLILDFNFVETGVQAHAPKYMEWYGAFGIMVTLVWMYIEVLRLLAKMRRR